MSVKYIIYFIVTILVIYSTDSLDINSIFKKNKIFQARLFYFFLVLALSYLVTNFIWDLYETTIFF